MDNNITILVDNDSWILPYAVQLCDELDKMGFTVKVVRDHALVGEGWINFMLGCMKITPEKILSRNQYNLVVHESELPQGKGFSPMTWQILEEKNEIPICLIEASERVDEGKIWIRDIIKLDGSELNREWRLKQGEKTIELCLRFIDEYEELEPEVQSGAGSFYKKRGPADSELDIKKTIQEQFNLLRVIDNDNYPAYFLRDNKKYIIKIERG